MIGLSDGAARTADTDSRPFRGRGAATGNDRSSTGVLGSPKVGRLSGKTTRVVVTRRAQVRRRQRLIPDIMLPTRLDVAVPLRCIRQNTNVQPVADPGGIGRCIPRRHTAMFGP